jgi:hypothetical protein
MSRHIWYVRSEGFRTKSLENLSACQQPHTRRQGVYVRESNQEPVIHRT